MHCVHSGVIPRMCARDCPKYTIIAESVDSRAPYRRGARERRGAATARDLPVMPGDHQAQPSRPGTRCFPHYVAADHSLSGTFASRFIQTNDSPNTTPLSVPRKEPSATACTTIPASVPMAKPDNRNRPTIRLMGDETDRRFGDAIAAHLLFCSACIPQGKSSLFYKTRKCAWRMQSRRVVLRGRRAPHAAGGSAQNTADDS